jgi:hypothetical protein
VDIALLIFMQPPLVFRTVATDRNMLCLCNRYHRGMTVLSVAFMKYVAAMFLHHEQLS